jgi:histidinol phosphatase-like enzyme
MCAPIAPSSAARAASRRRACCGAQQDLALDLAQSYLVGDAVADMEAARAAGVRGILVLTGRGHDQAALRARENVAGHRARRA